MSVLSLLGLDGHGALLGLHFIEMYPYTISYKVRSLDKQRVILYGLIVMLVIFPILMLNVGFMLPDRQMDMDHIRPRFRESCAMRPK